MTTPPTLPAETAALLERVERLVERAEFVQGGACLSDAADLLALIAAFLAEREANAGLRAALEGMLTHSYVADVPAEDKPEEDHDAERRVRAALVGDVPSNPCDGEIERLRAENEALLSGRSFHKHVACLGREAALVEEIARLTAELAQARAKALETIVFADEQECIGEALSLAIARDNPRLVVAALENAGYRVVRVLVSAPAEDGK